MTKKLLLACCFLLSVAACNINKTHTATSEFGDVVYAFAETDPVHTVEDGADDPAIWVNEQDPSKSLIYGTDKEWGILVYDLEGKLVQSYQLGRINNVDIVQTEQGSVLAATDRTTNSLLVAMIDEKGKFVESSIIRQKAGIPVVYGCCLYKSPKTGKAYAFMVDKSQGDVEQWEITPGSSISVEHKRSWSVGAKSEGMVADNKRGILYIGEEEKGIWAYKAEPDQDTERDTVLLLETHGFSADVEGLCIYSEEGRQDILVASMQGNHKFAMVRIPTNQYMGSFAVSAKTVDQVEECDGIEATSLALNEHLPKGMFVVHDGTNSNAVDTTKANQNFKFIDWQLIEAQMAVGN